MNYNYLKIYFEFDFITKNVKFLIKNLKADINLK